MTEQPEKTLAQELAERPFIIAEIKAEMRRAMFWPRDDKWVKELNETAERYRKWGLRVSIVSLISSIVSLLISIAAYVYWVQRMAR